MSANRNAVRILLSAMLAIPLAANAQSLEDKVSQVKKQQALVQGSDEVLVDSILLERARTKQSKALPHAVSEDTLAPQEMDSLFTGPYEVDIADSLSDAGSAKMRSPGDTIPSGIRRRNRALVRPALPKRYEQRIFRSVNRSLFASAKGMVGRDYVLGPGDAVTISLWGDKEKEYNLILNPEGKVFMEGVGLVALGGLNLNEAQGRLRERLAKIYSGISRGTSHVDISLGKAGPIRVFVLGEVKVPGGYVFSGNSSVLSAMYFAQGPTDIGTVRKLQLTRAGHKYSLDLYQYLIYGQALNPDALQDGDVLFASRADVLVEIKGDVGRPATYELKKGEGIKELLEFAGRLNPTAAQQKISLQRIFPGGKTEYLDLAPPQDYLSGKARMELQDGDKVLVERSRESSRNFVTITGPVKYPGTYSMEGVNNIHDIIAKAGGLREDAFLGRAHIVRFNSNGSSELFASALDSTGMDTVKLQPRDNVILYSLKEMYQPDSIDIAGAVFKPGRYEFRQGMTTEDLIMQAGGLLPTYEKQRLVIFRDEPNERKVSQIVFDPASQGDVRQSLPLRPRDLVQVPIDPRWYSKEIVILGGLVTRPGRYALLFPGEKLASVIGRAGGFKQNAYIEGGRFFRTRDSVGRVGVDIQQAVQKPKSKANISLVDGDSVFIPERLNTVKVIGEVGFETSVLYKEGASVQYYLEKAGGFTRRSERDRVVVQYANGETSRDGYFNRKPDAGSVIYVPQGPEPKPIDWLVGINAILGTLGVAAAVILSIQAIQGK